MQSNNNSKETNDTSKGATRKRLFSAARINNKNLCNEDENRESKRSRQSSNSNTQSLCLKPSNNSINTHVTGSSNTQSARTALQVKDSNRLLPSPLKYTQHSPKLLVRDNDLMRQTIEKRHTARSSSIVTRSQSSNMLSALGDSEENDIDADESGEHMLPLVERETTLLPSPEISEITTNPDESAMDTSIMSSAGQASLSNLNSLLSRMNIPSSYKRRRSSVLPSSSSITNMRSLDERAEMEEEIIAERGSPEQIETQTHPRLSAPDTVRYALSYTAEESARHSQIPTRPTTSGPAAALQHKRQILREMRDVGQRPSAGTALSSVGERSGKDSTRRRTSSGVPAAMKGSLLHLATSSNAAQSTIARSTSLSPEKPRASSSSSLSAPAASTQRSTILNDVVAFVDVKTSEGDEAGGAFIEMLRTLGARVLSRPTDSVTHIIYKTGKSATLLRYRAYVRKPHLVGIGWVVACREKNERVDEGRYKLDVALLEGVLVGAGKKEGGIKRSASVRQRLGGSACARKEEGNLLGLYREGSAKGQEQEKEVGTAAARRKSLEPRILLPSSFSTNNLSRSTSSFPTSGPSIFSPPSASNEEVERARRRSMQFAPKVGSPLKQRVHVVLEEEEDQEVLMSE